MVSTYTHICRGTCSSKIIVTFDREANKIVDIEVLGGCNGNLKGIRELVKGMDMDVVHDKLINVMCGHKNTSCPNQLALAIEEIKSGKED